MTERPNFDLGIVMAGAISAGAYTAGVLDFLFEALDALAAVRDGKDTSYLQAGLPGEGPIFDPGHDVTIKAMSGTSAGAMVTAITTTILGTSVPPVGPERKLEDTTPTGNPLYDAWVNKIHYTSLLETRDLAGKSTLHSLLDGTVLDEIVGGTLAYAQKNDVVRSYIAPGMPVYLCVSNLRGVRYSLSMNADPDAGTEHHMSMHADYVGFHYQPGPGAPAPDGLTRLQPGGDKTTWQALGNAALASGAFPVGLPARALVRPFADYVQRLWFDPGHLLEPTRRMDSAGKPTDPSDDGASWMSNAGANIPLEPLDSAEPFPPAGAYNFVNVDGGMFNNEPLELCRQAIATDGKRGPRDAADATRAVILIDPFPNLFKLDTDFDSNKQRALLSVLGKLVGAFTSQSRFKPSELALARDPYVASRYAIMPVRYDRNDKKAEFGIACGALGGFGGFLSKAFRHHDFMLGRRNCQRFLQRQLALPDDAANGAVNPLFRDWPTERRDQFAISKDYQRDGNTVRFRPVVPLLGKLASSEYTRVPDWPATPADLRMADLEERISARADAVKQALLDELKPAWWLRWGIEGVWWKRKTAWIRQFAIDRVKQDLTKRGHQVG